MTSADCVSVALEGLCATRAGSQGSSSRFTTTSKDMGALTSVTGPPRHGRVATDVTSGGEGSSLATYFGLYA